VTAGFLLDTNVPSELTRPSPDPRVIRWVASHDDLHLSVISIGELRRGLALLAPGKRRLQLEHWFGHSLLPLVATRILPITQPIADRWGLLGAECQLRGAPLNLADGLIAATALEHRLTVVTRNGKDFAGLGVAILNPWDDPPSG
jgi:predicted nucleic acid-binding protein